MKSNKNLSSSIVCCGFRQLHISFYTVSSHFDSGWKNAGSTKTLKDPLLIFVFPSGIDANLRVLGEKNRYSIYNQNNNFRKSKVLCKVDREGSGGKIN